MTKNRRIFQEELIINKNLLAHVEKDPMQRIPDASSFEECIGIRIAIENPYRKYPYNRQSILMTRIRTVFQEELR